MELSRRNCLRPARVVAMIVARRSVRSTRRSTSPSASIRSTSRLNPGWLYRGCIERCSSLIGNRRPQLVGREDAVGTRDAVEDECEMDPRDLRVRLPYQEVGAVGTEESGQLVDRSADDGGIHGHATRTTGLLCIVLSPKLGSPIACRLPRPPHTIGTIWSGRST